MSWSRVQAFSQNAQFTASSHASSAVTLGSAVAAGDVVCVGVSFSDNPATMSVARVVDSLGNVYRRISVPEGGDLYDSTNNQCLVAFYSIVRHAGTPTITFWIDAKEVTGSFFVGLKGSHFSGGDLTSVFRGAKGRLQVTPGTGSNAVTTASGTGTLNATSGDLLWAISGEPGVGSATTETAGTGFTGSTIDATTTLIDEWKTASGGEDATFSPGSGGSSGTYMTIAIAITPARSTTNDPTIVQHLALSNTGPSSATHITAPIVHLYLPNLTLSGNCLVVDVLSKTGPTSITITDDQSQTYTAAVNGHTDATNGWVVWSYYVLNCAAGVRHITVTFNGADGDYVNVIVTERRNVATVSAIDGTPIGFHGAASGIWSAGSTITTANAGSLLHVSMWAETIPIDWTSGLNSTALEIAIPGSGYELVSADLRDGRVTQERIQLDAGATTPVLLAGDNTAAFIGVALALKASAGAGSTPGTGIRIVSDAWFDVGASTSLDILFPCRGNLLVFRWLGFIDTSESGAITSITDNYGNTWSHYDGAHLTNTGYPQVWYAQNAVTASDLKVSLTFTGAGAHKSGGVLADIAGAKTSSVLGATNNGTGTLSVSGDQTTITLTPTTANSLCFVVMGNEFGTAKDAFGTSIIPDNPWTTSEDGQESRFHEDNGWAHAYNPNTTTLTWSWHRSTTPPGEWAAASAEFLAFVPPPSTTARLRGTMAGTTAVRRSS